MTPGSIFTYTVREQRRDGSLFVCPIKVQVISADASAVKMAPLEEAIDAVTGVTVMALTSTINIIPQFVNQFLK